MTESNAKPEVAAVGRREFLQLVAAAGVAAALPAAADAFAQSTAPAPKPAVAPDTTAHAAAPSGPSDDALALAGVLRRRFPGRLSEEQWTSVTRDLDGRLASGKRLRESKLANGAEPDFTFRS